MNSSNAIITYTHKGGETFPFFASFKGQECTIISTHETKGYLCEVLSTSGYHVKRIYVPKENLIPLGK